MRSLRILAAALAALLALPAPTTAQSYRRGWAYSNPGDSYSYRPTRTMNPEVMRSPQYRQSLQTEVGYIDPERDLPSRRTWSQNAKMFERAAMSAFDKMKLNWDRAGLVGNPARDYRTLKAIMDQGAAELGRAAQRHGGR